MELCIYSQCVLWALKVGPSFFKRKMLAFYPAGSRQMWRTGQALPLHGQVLQVPLPWLQLVSGFCWVFACFPCSLPGPLCPDILHSSRVYSMAKHNGKDPPSQAQEGEESTVPSPAANNNIRS